MFRTNWFGLEEWKDLGLEIRGTASNEAVKLYDAALTQFACFYDDPNHGGLLGTIDKLNQADPNFILGRTFSLDVKLFSFTQSYYHDAFIKNEVDHLECLIEQQKDQITQREYKHVLASSKMSKMDLEGSARILEDILDEYPNDMLALRMCFYHYFFTGQKKKMFNLISKFYPHFAKESNPFSTFIDGFMAFVLEENYQYSEAEKFAKLGLSKNSYNGWATHAFAHVCEMNGRFEEGKDFMAKNVDFWSKTNHLACHNNWHWSLFNISLDKFDEADHIFDRAILPSILTNKTCFNIADGTSFLLRSSFLRNDKNETFKSKFEDIYEVCKPYLNKHILGFCDVPFAMACIGSGHRNEAKKMLETLEASELMSIREDQAKTTARLIEAMMLYDDGNFEKAADILASIKDEIVVIGGSDAQRDVFNQLLIVSTMKSSKLQHKQLLQKLVIEREQFKKNDKFIQKCNQIYQQNNN